MDYSDDRCLNIFTQEQVGVMRAILQTSRAGVAYVTGDVSGIKNLALLDGIEVSPNPSTGIFKLTTKRKEDLNFEVYNSLGETVIAAQNFSSSVSINLSSFSAGIYFAKISSSENVVVKRLVLNR
ncbi:MAG: zinc-dependent metalloprotease [Bacteroidetes bacterium]|nr:zinc-dependent metalloprotease [Bacteroidota bacterium]